MSIRGVAASLTRPPPYRVFVNVSFLVIAACEISEHLLISIAQTRNCDIRASAHISLQAFVKRSTGEKQLRDLSGRGCYKSRSHVMTARWQQIPSHSCTFSYCPLLPQRSLVRFFRARRKSRHNDVPRLTQLY